MSILNDIFLSDRNCGRKLTVGTEIIVCAILVLDYGLEYMDRFNLVKEFPHIKSKYFTGEVLFANFPECLTYSLFPYSHTFSQVQVT